MRLAAVRRLRPGRCRPAGLATLALLGLVVLAACGRPLPDDKAENAPPGGDTTGAFDVGGEEPSPSLEVAGDAGLAKLVRAAGRAFQAQDDVDLRFAEQPGDAAYAALCFGCERDAADFASRAAPIAQALESRFEQMINTGNLGLAALLTGQTDVAANAFREELSLCRDMVVRPVVNEGLRGLAAVAVVNGDAKRAATLLGAAETHHYDAPEYPVNARLDETFFEPARARCPADLWNAAARRQRTELRGRDRLCPRRIARVALDPRETVKRRLRSPRQPRSRWAHVRHHPLLHGRKRSQPAALSSSTQPRYCSGYLARQRRAPAFASAERASSNSCFARSVRTRSRSAHRDTRS